MSYFLGGFFRSSAILETTTEDIS